MTALATRASIKSTELRYAQSPDGAELAYRVIGEASPEGRDLVLLTAGTTPMDALFEDPIAARLLEHLTSIGRVVLFDRSGIGLSDPPSSWDVAPFQRWQDDLEAVVSAAGLSHLVLVAMSLSASVAFLYCERRPDQVTAMVLVEPYPPTGPDQDLVRAQLNGDVDSVSLLCPSRADEPGFRAWFTLAGRSGASPRLATHAHPAPDEHQTRRIEDAAAKVDVPTLVLRRPAHPLSPDRDHDRVLALLPRAVRVDLPGSDLLIFGNEIDALLSEIAQFLTGEQRPPEPERVLAAVLFTDLVESTRRSAAAGDAAWRRILDEHDDLGRTCVGRRGGTVVKTTGDGLMAVLPTATNALLAAQELRQALGSIGLEVRAGVHVGEIERRDDDVSGLAVAIAARVMALAVAGEVLVSEVVPVLVTGSPIRFEDHGRHQLKGVPGARQVYAVVG